MTRTADPATLAGAELAVLAPELVHGYAAALPAAIDIVSRRLLGAAARERIGAYGTLLRGRAVRRYGFDRIELTEPVRTHPARLLTQLGIDAPGLSAELTDACVNLAVALARRPGWAPPTPLTLLTPPVWDGVDADEQMLRFERLATEGHALHPCGRTRLGWRVADLLAHDQESAGTSVGFVAVREDLHVGDDVGALLRAGYPDLPAVPAGYRLQPVHAWQLSAVIPHRYADLLASGALRLLPGAALPAQPTTALRTVLLAPDRYSRRRYLKLSLDIQVTSTRRTISVASTRNGPAISTLLDRLLDGHERVLTLPEIAGAAVVTPDGRSRDLSVIVRDGLSGRLAPNEVVVPAAALFARTGRDTVRLDTAGPDTAGRRTSGPDTVLDQLLAQYPAGPLDFLTDYTRLLLPPLLHLARSGIGLEAHLQNSLPTFMNGVPHRIAFRDFAGLRLHLPRLGGRITLWPGSVIGTGDVGVLRAKLGYTAFQAHLGELIRHLTDHHRVTRAEAWRQVRVVLDRCGAEPGDHAFLTAPRVPHKALVRMRLAGTGDIYLPVPNPLHDP